MDYAQLIGKSEGVQYLYKSNGNTTDIINAILYADTLCAPYTKKLTGALATNDLKTTCYNFWKFFKDYVKYKEDPKGVQMVQSPGYSVDRGFADCKSFSVGIASLLQNAGIKYFYRFTTEVTGEDFHHVYVVVPSPAGEIILDCVLDEFNHQNTFVSKRDIVPASVRKMAPPKQMAGIGATQSQVYDNSWIAIDKAFKDGARDFKAACLDSGYNDISASTHYHPLQRSKLNKAWTQNLDRFIDGSNSLVYLYWDTTKAAKPAYVDYKGQLIMFSTKVDEGRDWRDMLKDIGIADSTLLMLCRLSIFNLYGITLEHMLDRCYNMANYGQPWKPTPGMPYYDFPSGTFVNQGTTPESLQMTLQIAMCCPAAGGITRPYGQPYISVAGWFIQNGASDSAFATYKSTYHWSAVEKSHVVNNGTGLNADAFAPCWATYQRWLGGNMPALPNIDPANSGFGGLISGPKKNAIAGDLGVSAIIGIVIACITAVLAITQAIMAIIAKTKQPRNEVYMPNPPADFKMEYQTVGGCYVGTAPAECGPGKARYCPDGTFTCLTPEQLNLPENQPGTPAGGFIGSSSNLLILAAGAALILFGLMTGKSKK